MGGGRRRVAGLRRRARAREEAGRIIGRKIGPKINQIRRLWPAQTVRRDQKVSTGRICRTGAGQRGWWRKRSDTARIPDVRRNEQNRRVCAPEDGVPPEAGQIFIHPSGRQKKAGPVPSVRRPQERMREAQATCVHAAAGSAAASGIRKIPPAQTKNLAYC